MSLDFDSLTLASRDARGLAIDAVHKCSSGHLGLPLGATEIGAVLYGHAMQHDPTDPTWLNRDRFILSAGHGSMFLYTWLHLSGYDVSRDDLKAFRQLHSKTPGHPEHFETPGVEATTGPLGQGVSNAVGYAISAKMCEAKFNTAEHAIFDHHVVCLAGDGCLQEGVAQEASALAAHLDLDNLILFYDSNNVTLDAMGPVSQSEDTGMRYRAYGWDVHEIDGQNLNEVAATFEKAKAATSGKPQFIIAKTLIGKSIPEVEGTQKAHGEGGAKFAEEARAGLGLPEETFFVAPETEAYFASRLEKLKAARADWDERFTAWEAGNADLAKELADARGEQGAQLAGTDSGVRSRAENGDSQGRWDGVAVDCESDATADQRKCGFARLDKQLHRWRWKFRRAEPRRAKFPFWHSRARHVRHFEWSGLRRNFPSERSDVFGL